MFRLEPGIEPAFVGTVIPHLERLGLLGRRVEVLVALGVDALFSLVGDGVLVADAAVAADLVERNLAVLQYLNQERSRSIEFVSGLLCREFGMDWDDGDCAAFTDLGEDVDEEPQRRHRDPNRVGDALVVVDLDPPRLGIG